MMASILITVYAFVRNFLEETSTTCPVMLLIVIATQYSLNTRILLWSVNNRTQIKLKKMSMNPSRELSINPRNKGKWLTCKSEAFF